MLVAIQFLLTPVMTILCRFIEHGGAVERPREPRSVVLLEPEEMQGDVCEPLCITRRRT